MPEFTLVSSDNEEFVVDIAIANMFLVIKRMLEDLNMIEDGGDEKIPLANVRGDILKRVIEWATYHKDDPPAPEEDDAREKRTDDINITQWDKDFLSVDPPILFDLILAANYLDMPGLLDVAGKMVETYI